MIRTAIISDLLTHQVFKAHGLKEEQFYTRETPFGYSNYLHFFQHGENQFVTLSRLGENQEMLSHPFVNYKADLWSLKELGISNIVSLSAARSLTKIFEDGMLFIPDDVLEWKSSVAKQFFDEKQRKAIRAEPAFCPDMREKALSLFTGNKVISEGCLALSLGSRHETTAEKKLLVSQGCLASNQPLFQEFWLAHEIEFCYLSLCLLKSSDDHLSEKDISPLVEKLLTMTVVQSSCCTTSLEPENSSPEWWKNL